MLVILLYVTSFHLTNSQISSYNKISKKSHNSIQKTLDYYSEQYSEFNIDGLIPLKIIHDQLQNHKQQQLLSFAVKAKNIYDKALHKLQRKDLNYYKVMSPFLTANYSVTYQEREFNKSLLWTEIILNKRQP